jgi:acyl-CoA reductase-like NAD-dependent aldehyde dehydrogenase
MPFPTIEGQLVRLREAEASEPWAAKSANEIAELCSRVADLIHEEGNTLSRETANQMGVTPAEVWLEVIFPSVWGLLSLARSLRKKSSEDDTSAELGMEHCTAATPLISGAGGSFNRLRQPIELREVRNQRSEAMRLAAEWLPEHSLVPIMPLNRLESLLLPGFHGYAVLGSEPGPNVRKSVPQTVFQEWSPSLALCLLPFNLASIGILDIIYLLCFRRLRVVAKVSEKAEFMRPYLETIFSPFMRTKGLLFVSGGPEIGAQLASRPEFTHIHLTGSHETAAKVERQAGDRTLSSELGGVTPAVVLPDALSTRTGVRQVARQIAFGALANNGQHCVSFQVVLVPESHREAFEKALWYEMMTTGSRREATNECRQLIDWAAAQRLEGLIEDARTNGARVTSSAPRANGKIFPVSLISGVNDRMRLFREEAFGPVVGTMGLPDADFGRHALQVLNGPELLGDLAASVFTARLEGQQARKIVSELRHGVVTVNTYPGIAFATSLPWGAGPAGVSGRGWMHNHLNLPEANLRKVVLAAPLGRKGFGPLRWEDPWLLNVGGTSQLDFGQALVALTRAYFQRRLFRLPGALMHLISAIVRREIISRWQDQNGGAH